MSYKTAVTAKCKECIYDPIGNAGTWRQQVEACTVTSCPLFNYRPKITKSNRPKITKKKVNGLMVSDNPTH